jgi:hypothetical protein
VYPLFASLRLFCYPAPLSVNEPEMYIICMPDFVSIAGSADPGDLMPRVFLPPSLPEHSSFKKNPLVRVIRVS